jgi:pimeloyl-ACP methyl ester carboxylesterase
MAGIVRSSGERRFKMKKAILILLAVLLITPVVIYFAFPGVLYKASLALERKKAGLEEKVIKVQDHEIVYLEGGTGDTIVLVHGFACHKDYWTPFAKYLTPEFHVVALDVPGFAESSRIEDQSYNMTSQALRLDQFVSALKLSNFHIAGNSMGGTISGRYAALFPDKVLTLGLIDTGGVSSCEKSELLRRLERGQNPLLVETLEEFDETMRLAYVQPPSLPTPVKRFLLKQAIADRAFNEKIFNEVMQEEYSMEADFTKIEADTLILWGDTDHFLDVSCAKTLEEGIEKSTVVIMKNCGHVPMMERPEEAAEHYLSFLKR